MAAQSLQGGQMQAQNVGTGFNLGGALIGAGIGALGSIASGYGEGLAGNGD
jgi:F0F1-type ATP synthase membrane subunit c/vacuolar-type H+-ATPase subunit K